MLHSSAPPVNGGWPTRSFSEGWVAETLRASNHSTRKSKWNPRRNGSVVSLEDGAGGWSASVSAAELYKAFAKKCFSWAAEASQDEFRRTCLEMAKTWTYLAEQGTNREGADGSPVVLCTHCGAPMTASEPKPIRSSGLREIPYLCPSCGFATARFVLAPGKHVTSESTSAVVSRLAIQS